MNEFTNYLKQRVAMTRSIQKTLPDGYHYYSPEDFCLDRGVDMVSAPLTDDEVEYVLSVIDQGYIARFRQKQCYYNAQCVVLSDDQGLLQYQEGIASGRARIPMNHGWFTINGKVIDLTWRTEKPNHRGRLRNRVFGVIPEGWVYRGTNFDPDMLRQRMRDTESISSVIDSWPYHEVFKMERLAPCDVKPIVWPSPDAIEAAIASAGA